MKIKKTIAAVAAALTAFTMSASTLTACNSGHEHAFAWKVQTPATCTTEGLETGVCGICGYPEERVIPKTDEHPYGEWDITPPTEQEEGKAVKVCTADSNHVLEVTLPKVTAEGTGYTSSAITKPATSVSKGERTFVLSNAAGDISFIVYTPEKEVETVEDAVLIGASKKELIRSVSGQFSVDTTRYNSVNYFYEFGENYMHSEEDGSQTKVWCSLDENGETYLIKTETGKPMAQEVGAAIENMDGFGYSLGYTSSNRWYGAESLLAGLYSIASENINQDFRESIGTAAGGASVYKFQFGTHGATYYSDVYVEFTLYDNYAIKTLKVDTEVYDADSWELDEDTEIAKPTARVPSGRELITVETVLRTPEDEEPVNPYKKENFSVKSFDLYYGAGALTDETVTNVSADSIYSFNIKNVQHFGEDITGDIKFDPVQYFLRTEEGEEPVSFEASYDGISVWTSNDTTVNIRSYMTGEITLVIRTQSGACERLLKLNISKIAPPLPAVGEPATFFPSVYLFGGERYYWQSLATATKEQMQEYCTIFVGQSLRFKADVPQTMLSYVDPSATATIHEVTGATAEDATVEAAGDEENVYVFTAQKTGVYTVRLTSKVSAGRYIQLPITVAEKPDISTVLSGEYEGRVNYPAPNGVKVTFNSNGATTGTITVTLGSLGTETLNYSWDGEKLTTTHASGRNDASNGFGFSVSLNAAYNIVVTHPRGVGSENETVVLYKN